MAPMTLPEGTTLDDLWARQAYTGTSCAIILTYLIMHLCKGNLAINAAVAFGILFWD